MGAQVRTLVSSRLGVHPRSRGTAPGVSYGRKRAGVGLLVMRNMEHSAVDGAQGGPIKLVESR